jgi:hypothetical protein
MSLFSRILERLGLRQEQSDARTSTPGTSTKARKPGGRAPTSDEEVRGAEASARTREKEGAAVQETATRKK